MNLSCKQSPSTDESASWSPVVYPNSGRGRLTLEFNSTASLQYLLRVTDLPGQLVHQQMLNTDKGVNRFEIDLSELPAGIYLLGLISPDEQSRIIRLVIQ